MAFLVAPLRHLPGSAGAEQLEQVVGETDQFPFRSDLLQSAQQEPSKPTPLFDLPKHRFHNRLAHPIQVPPPNTLETPRSRNRRNPRHSLICPNTGSTIALRIRYRSRPACVFSFCFICSSNPASAVDSLASSSPALLGSPCFCFPVATCKSIPCTRASPTCFPFQ